MPTLVLINGRRVAPYPFAQTGTTAFVDLNSIPLAAIQQIDVLRDGASAIYGSDAIAGVVNVRFLPRYHGALASFGYGNTTDTDTGEYYTTLVTGYTNEQRGIEMMVVADYFDRNALFQVGSVFLRIDRSNPAGWQQFSQLGIKSGHGLRSRDGRPAGGARQQRWNTVTVSELTNNPGRQSI